MSIVRGISKTDPKSSKDKIKRSSSQNSNDQRESKIVASVILLIA